MSVASDHQPRLALCAAIADCQIRPHPTFASNVHSRSHFPSYNVYTHGTVDNWYAGNAILMSGHVRARRPASPPPGVAHGAPTPSQRFPHPRDEHLDADARRAAASKGFGPGRVKSYPPGGLHMTGGEWKLLFVVVLVAAGVRLFRLAKPNSVV